jgi:hypothetical protein
MNIIVIILFLIITWTINAEVEVIPVYMPITAIKHAKELTRVINLKENQGCKLFNMESYNNVTYLYFRCEQKS